MRRWAETAALGSMLALGAIPFVGLFPQPPAFGRGAAGIVAAFAIPAMMGTAFRATQPRRRRILGWAGILLTITAAAIAVRILLARTVEAKIPTLDILPALFGLEGEDIDDAVLYERWVEVWLGCALAASLVAALARGLRRPGPATPPVPAVAAPPWNAATVLLWLLGWAVLGGAVLDGHWTAQFLAGAIHVPGTIADPQPHPTIRFTTVDGTVIEFTQNGYVSRPLGTAVPIAYLAANPAGSARADTFWANWSEVLGLAWVGLGFTVSPFYGLRAGFRAGRW